MNHKIQQHPTISHKDEMNSICKPLVELADIDYFAHVRVDNQGRFACLGKNPGFIEHYLKNEYYNFDVHMIQNDQPEEYVIHDNIEPTGLSKKLKDECPEFSLNHVFSILLRDENHINAYHFATSKQQSGFNELYLRHLPTLKNFITHFNFQVHKDKQLNAAYQHTFKMSKTACYQSKYQDVIHVNQFVCDANRHYLPSSENIYLTQREMEVIALMRNGCAAPEIAMLLKITERTVREHINNLKAKFQCKTLYQLGELVAKLIHPHR